MEKAFQLAQEALAAGEVPVGCIFLHAGEILATGRNTVNETHNATHHAEMDCVDDVIKKCKGSNHSWSEVFKEVEVFVTCEPCIMCAQLLLDIQVKRIVYGCANERFGGCGSVINVFEFGTYLPVIQGGIRKEEAVKLLKQFYDGENPNAPNPKLKKPKK